MSTEKTTTKEDKNCSCLRCERHFYKPEKDNIFASLDVSMTKMFVCSICGNKRCPHSDDHDNACTNSNAPGQTGSRYQ